jgi:hypothetical protein
MKSDCFGHGSTRMTADQPLYLLHSLHVRERPIDVFSLCTIRVHPRKSVSKSF